MKKSLKNTLMHFFFLGRAEWISSAHIERMVFKNRNGTVAKPSSVSRELRQLESTRQIAVKYEGNVGSATYKYLPRNLRANYIPFASRPAHRKKEMWRVPLKELANRTLPMDLPSEKYWASLPEKAHE